MEQENDALVPNPISVAFSKKPSELRYMLEAFRRSPRLSRLRPATRFSANWSGHRISSRSLADFNAIAGLPTETGVSILYPHVFGFPLHMAILTHPEFPIPIWRNLQIRNTLVQHRPITQKQTIDFSVRVSSQRILARGVEIDLHSVARTEQGLAWESLVTFYGRGSFGTPEEAVVEVPRAPSVDGPTVCQWRMPRGRPWRFGRFTGDHNGIHLFDWYARLFGFRGALYHPPVVLGHCLSRLTAGEVRNLRRIDVWLKGPVYRGASVILRSDSDSDSLGRTFALTMSSEERPSIVGRLISRSSDTAESIRDAPILGDPPSSTTGV